jgi:hypothetical protein
MDRTFVVLAITTVILSIRVLEPSSPLPLGRKQREPELPTHRRLSDSAALRPWRVAVEDSTEALALGTPVSDNPRERLSEFREVAELGNRPGLSEAAFQPGTGPRWSQH